jgi:hypothetical protein
MKLSASALALAFTMSLPAGPQGGPIQLPDPSTGLIDGRDAALVWPARYRDSTSYELLPVAGCGAHFVPSTNLAVELTHPCGKWLSPEPGKYKVWLQGKDFISPHPLVLSAVNGSTGRGYSMVAPVVPSGLVALSNEVRLGAGEGLRLLSLKAQFFDDWGRAFDRRVPDARQPAAMPAGSALAGVFDQKTGDAIALSRPLVVAANQTVVAKPAPPDRDSDVLVVLQKPLAPKREALQVSLKADAGPRRPDVLLHASDAVFAIWYGVGGNTATVTVDGDSLTLAPVALRLVPKRITTFRGALQAKPRLKVSVLAPQDVFEKMRVSVGAIGDPEPFRTKDVIPGTTDLEALPPQRLRVTLAADQWTFVQDVDLTDGRDGEVTFVLEPIIARGTVYLAKEPARARIAFQYGGRDLTKVETGEEGRYEAVLWQSGMYAAKVTLVNDDAAAFIDPAVDLERTRTLDFHLPGNRIVARVFNRNTGLPIASATVGVVSEATHDEVGKMTLGHRYTTDDNGVLVLPRLRSGHARIEASAPGFAPSEPQEIDVEEATKRALSFALEAVEITRVRVVLPNGAPAAGAEALAVEPTSGRVIWRGSAASGGDLEIGSRRPNTVVIVRHPQASTRALLANAIGETLQLAPGDLTPVVVRSTNTSGEPVRFALLSVWIDGLRFTDVAAAFATWSTVSMTDADGVWSGRNLPAAPIRVLATRNVTPEQLAAGAYDGLAQTVPYPRAPTIAVRVVE